MLYRWTLWESDRGEAVQLSLCVLDNSWEPQAEWTKQLGPFHDAEWARLALHDEARRWLATVGIQLELGEAG